MIELEPENDAVRLFALSDRRKVAEFPATAPVRAVAFSPDGRYLVAGNDAKVRLLQAIGGREVAELANQGPVRSAVFSSDGLFVGTGSDDGRARVFDARTGRQLAQFTYGGPVLDVRFSHDGSQLYSLAKTSNDAVLVTTREWFRVQDLIREGCARVQRALTRDEWQQYLPDQPYRKTCPTVAEPR